MKTISKNSFLLLSLAFLIFISSGKVSSESLFFDSSPYPGLLWDAELSAHLKTLLQNWTEKGTQEPFPPSAWIQYYLPRKGFFNHLLELYFLLSSSLPELKKSVQEVKVPLEAKAVGIGMIQNRDSLYLALVAFYHPKVKLSFSNPFQKRGAQLTLQGEVLAPYQKAEIYLSKPEGEVLSLEDLSSKKQVFKVALPPLLEEGEYRFEVVVNHPKEGPTVGLIVPLYVGIQEQEPVFVSFVPKSVEEGESYLFKRVQEEREKMGRKPLLLDPLLTQVAREHSQDMIRRGFFAHINPDGLDPSGRFKKRGGVGQVGENLAKNSDLEAAHQGLMGSPGHRANILSQDYTHIGIGVAFDGTSYFVTELFSFFPEKVHPEKLKKEIVRLFQGQVKAKENFELQEDPLLGKVAQENATFNRREQDLTFFVGGKHMYDYFQEQGGSYTALVCGVYLDYEKEKLLQALADQFPSLYQDRYTAVGVGLEQGVYQGTPNALYVTVCFLKKE